MTRKNHEHRQMQCFENLPSHCTETYSIVCEAVPEHKFTVRDEILDGVVMVEVLPLELHLDFGEIYRPCDNLVVVGNLKDDTLVKE